MITTLLAIVAIAALVGMIYCSKKKDNLPAPGLISTGLLLLVLICSGSIVYRVLYDPEDKDIMRSEARYLEARAYVAGKAANAKSAALLTGPEDEISLTVKNDMDGLEQSGISDVKRIAISAPNMKNGLTFSERVTPEAIEKALGEASSYDAIFVGVSLPKTALEVQYWRNAAGKKPLYFLERPEFPNLDRMLEAGMFTGIIISKSDYDYEKIAPKNLQQAFDVRFILVTKDNLKENQNALK